MLFKKFGKYFSGDDAQAHDRVNVTYPKGKSRKREKSLKENFFPSTASAAHEDEKSRRVPQAEDQDMEAPQMRVESPEQAKKGEGIRGNPAGLKANNKIAANKHAPENPWEIEQSRVRTLPELLDAWKRGREENFDNYKAGIIDKEDYEQEETRLDSKYRTEIHNLGEKSPAH